MLKQLDETVSQLFTEQEKRKVETFVNILLTQRLLKKDQRVIDLCCGNGLLSYWLTYSGLAEQALLIGNRETRRLKQLMQLSNSKGLNCVFYQQDVNSLTFQLPLTKTNTIILAIHACGELSDRVLQIGMQYKLPFALVTCCHSKDSNRQRYQLTNPPDPRMLLYKRPADYADAVRQQYVEEQGWTARIEHLPSSISPQNNVIIAIPREKES